jgi:hypothetical protein
MSRAVKAICFTLLVLMCSVVYAQKNPSIPKNQPKSPVKQPVDSIRQISNSIPVEPLVWPEDTTTYIDPLDTVELIEAKSAITTKVKYHADDTIIYDAVNQVVHLFGNAKVEYEDFSLVAEYIKIELNKTLVHANGVRDSFGVLQGTPVFTNEGTEYKVQRVSYNYKTKKGYLSELRTKEGEGYVRGTDVIRSPDNEFGIRKSYYTTCDADTPHYHIQAARLKIIPDKKIVTGSANLQIEGMPTPLVIPFGIFSIKKGQSSGIIIPTYGSSINRGFFLRNGGYYFGLGQKADYMVTGDIYSQGSWALNNLLRYNTRYRFNGQLGVNYANNKFGSIEDPNFNQSKDLRINWLHNSDPKARPGTLFSANVNYVSSNYLANNSYVASNILANQINSSINYSKSFANGKYNLSTNGSMSQNLQTKAMTITLPAVTFTVSSFNPFKPASKPTAEKWYENISTNYTLNFRNQINTYDSLLFGVNRNRAEFARYYDTAGKYGLQHLLPIQTSFKLFKYYTLGVSANLSETWYFQTVNKQVENGSVVSNQESGFARVFEYSPSATLTTRYFGMKTFKGDGIKAIRHVVTPRVGVNYKPDYSNSSWGYYNSYRDTLGKVIRYNRFEGAMFGGASAGEQGNISFGVDNNIEIKAMRGKDTARKEQKIQILERFNIGSAYNMLADSLNLAPFNISAGTKLFGNITLNGNAILDPYRNVISTNPASGFRTVTRVHEYYAADGKLGTLTNASLGLSSSFNPQTFKKKSEEKRKKFENELKYISDNPNDYYDFNIPWTLNINYTMQYAKYNALNNPEASNYIQTLNFSGDVNLTKNWKIAGSSGYDFQNKKITFTTVDIVRDLHCWTFKLTWIPIGFRQSFFFQINVKASVLQELKLTKRREWFDRPL